MKSALERLAGALSKMIANGVVGIVGLAVVLAIGAYALYVLFSVIYFGGKFLIDTGNTLVWLVRHPLEFVVAVVTGVWDFASTYIIGMLVLGLFFAVGSWLFGLGEKTAGPIVQFLDRRLK